MEKIPVRIQIDTKQAFDQHTDRFQTYETGLLYQKENAIYLTYHESNDDRKEIRTVWKVKPTEAVLIRQGGTGLRARFEEGAVDRTALVTEHGTWPIEIQTSYLRHNLSLNGGSLRVAYQMDMSGAISQMELDIQVKVLSEIHKEVHNRDGKRG
ncbi:DUF1934 domain-containing protein [Effusibacillus dendaii]|uniref:DUF1934 domain-containing protein n=1 Tax=Effusibacillus dendaii TaxID=2743772 RepID=A0A7I8DBS7_9BACL|nr:DUF1934 domain-containing protein [Effusibacillus dendaii]BCJ87633.1 hypothetical protein skT53_26180 [Effusibacillus dendaii]